MNRLLTTVLLFAAMCPIVSAQLVTEIKPGAKFWLVDDYSKEAGVVDGDAVWVYGKRMLKDGGKPQIWYDKPKYSESQKEYVIFHYGARPYNYIVGNEERPVKEFHPLAKKAIQECRLAVAVEDLHPNARKTQMYRIKKKVTLFQWHSYWKRFKPDTRETWLMELVPVDPE